MLSPRKSTSASDHVSFRDWTLDRRLASFGTNAGSQTLPFQRWRHFKEAFAPELVQRAVAESPIPVSRCLDPFAGSGTTALACQFLGVRPTTIELNPYLADLVEAKLVCYDADALAQSLGKVVKALQRSTRTTPFPFREAPPTLVEPGQNGRWIFDRAIAIRVSALLDAIARLANTDHVRLFRVLVGGVLIDISNVVVSGKGRRYRRQWTERKLDPRVVEQRFSEAAQRAIAEIHRYSKRACTDYDLLRGDCPSVDTQNRPVMDT